MYSPLPIFAGVKRGPQGYPLSVTERTIMSSRLLMQATDPSCRWKASESSLETRDSKCSVRSIAIHRGLGFYL